MSEFLNISLDFGSLVIKLGGESIAVRLLVPRIRGSLSVLGAV